MPPQQPVPKKVDLNTNEGYIINQFTGDSIKPILNSLGDTVLTGVPVPIQGKVIPSASLAKPEIIPAVKAEVNPAHPNVQDVPENLTVIPVNRDELKTFIPGMDTSGFVLVNSLGDTIPTGVPLPAEGRVRPCVHPQPTRVLAPRMVIDASMNIQYLSYEQGLSSYISTILEDSRGNLWIGTSEGVTMYNGVSRIRFTEKEGFISLRIESILEDSRGNLWFGTHMGGIIMYNGKSFTHYNSNWGPGFIAVNSILEDSHGNIWFASRGRGVIRYDGENFTHITSNEGLISNRISSMAEDRNGDLWFCSEQGVSIYNGETFKYFNEKDGLPGLNSEIFEDRHGNFWFGHWVHGLSMYDGKRITRYTRNEGLSSGNVTSIMEDRKGNLWFGTFDGGAIMYNGESFTHLTEKEGLRDNQITAGIEDSHGNLWFGTRFGGLNIYNPRSFRNFTDITKTGQAAYVTVLAEDINGNIWMGTWGGKIYVYNGNSFTNITTTGEADIRLCRAFIVEDRNGRIWFGDWSTGVKMYNGKTITHFTDKAGLSSNEVHSGLEDSQGNLWFGTTGGISRYDGYSFTHFTVEEGLIDNYITGMMEDRDGNLWFGTRNTGIIKYDGETITYYTEKEGLSENNISFIVEDSRGMLWFGTYSSGVMMFDGNSFTYYSVNEGLRQNYITSVRKDNNDNIWISSFRELYQLTAYPSGPLPDYKVHTFGYQDGLNYSFSTLSKGMLDSKNRMWWGSERGLTMLDMDQYETACMPPSMNLDHIEIGGQFLDYRHLKDSSGISINGVAKFFNYPLDLELAYHRNHLTFYFSAIDWTAPHKIKYSYRMQGLDEKWSPPSPEPKAEYRNLPHGTFTFIVCATGAAQEWSEPFEYTFTIKPPWWHTWYARTGYAIFAVLLIVGIVRWRTARLKKRQKELEQTVKDRTAEISDKNEELSQQNEELASQRDEIEAQRDMVTKQKDQISEQKQAMTDSIQYAKRIQNAILPPEEVLKYLLPKHFILYRPRDIVSGDFYWLAQKKEKIIIAVADCTGHGVPGAFMSMLGNALLNDVVNKLTKLQANLILNELRDQVMFSLRQSGKQDEAKDGMDIALCVLDKEKLKLQFAGGYNSLIIIRNGELIEIKADKMPIGISSSAGKSFTNNELKLQKDDAIYMYSDGYVDQFGGPRGKKFLPSRFRQLLLDVQDKIMHDQKEILEHSLDEWMGLTGDLGKKYEQIDDIIVMGIKV